MEKLAGRGIGAGEAGAVVEAHGAVGVLGSDAGGVLRQARCGAVDIPVVAPAACRFGMSQRRRGVPATADESGARRLSDERGGSRASLRHTVTLRG